MKAPRSDLVAWIVWYLVAALAATAYFATRVLPRLTEPMDLENGVLLAREILALVVIVALAVLTHVALRWAVGVVSTPPPREKKVSGAGVAFPHDVTMLVGGWLACFSIAAIGALFWVLSQEGRTSDPMAALVAMVAAGLGSAVATIVGYLSHASERQDFDVAYTPWYFARPLMGLLLGLIFFLLLKAGLLATYPRAGEAAGVNEWGIAGMAALVGLFSKPAIDKLREVFNVLFRTEGERDTSLLARLPDELRDQVRPYLQNPEPPKAGAGSEGKPGGESGNEPGPPGDAPAGPDRASGEPS